VRIRIGTRGSRLALAQAEGVAHGLRALGAQVELVTIRTSGDRLAQAALADFGGKALFVKEIEEALLARAVDLGVHSLKDVPSALAPGLCLGAFPAREDPSDVLLGRAAGGLADLPDGATVGTSSLRRRALLLAARRDLRIAPIRGNVDTRLRKLEAGEYDALVLSQAGLTRLGLDPPHRVPLPLETFVPAVGQGILGLELRADQGALLELLGRLDHTETRMQALAERSFLLALGASCHTSVAGWARAEGDAVAMIGVVASTDGARILRASARGPGVDAEIVGRRVADELLAAGAADLLGLSATSGPAGGPRG